jgi:serine/threonine protein kinase
MSIDLDWLAAKFPDLSNLQLLGEGGQKFVFTCNHPQYKKVVLKLIKPGGEKRLEREIEAVKRVPNCVPQIYEINYLDSEIGQFVYILEDYIDGITLSDLLKKGPLDKSLILSLAYDLLCAATDAEAKKVVHRDIKPDNIKFDRGGKAWLLDFGIARILDMESNTRTDAALGPHSPGYGSPEQIRNRKRDIDGRSDLFAIGVTLYESATGINPFLKDARDRLEILRRVENEPLQRLTLTWDVKSDFSKFISSLTQKHSYQRPDTCKEALDWFVEINKSLRGE